MSDEMYEEMIELLSRYPGSVAVFAVPEKTGIATGAYANGTSKECLSKLMLETAIIAKDYLLPK